MAILISFIFLPHKILSSGNSFEIIKKLINYKLLVYLLPCFSVYASYPQVYENLMALDEIVRKAKDDNRAVEKDKLYLYLVKSLITLDEEMSSEERFQDIFRQIKILLSPITPPNYELENAVALFMKENGLKVPKTAFKYRKPEYSVSNQRNGKKKSSKGAQGNFSPANGSTIKKRKKAKKKVITKENNN